MLTRPNQMTLRNPRKARPVRNIQNGACFTALRRFIFLQYQYIVPIWSGFDR